MKKSICVIATDSVNKYNTIFPASSLENCLSLKRNGIPLNIGHDYLLTVGWVNILSLFIEPGLSKVMAQTNIPETPEEIKEIEKLCKVEQLNKIFEQCKPYIDSMKNEFSDHLTSEAKLHCAHCPCYYDKGIVTRVHPELWEMKDDDGLIPVDSLNYLGNGVFEKNGHIIFPHSYFRRAFSPANSINYHFFERVSELREKHSIKFKIAIDYDLIGVAEAYSPFMELEYWWGPKFSNDLSSIENGVTVHKTEEKEKSCHGIEKTEFWWTSRAGLKTLEIEEQNDSPSPAINDKYGCRYIHSIVNESNNEIIHLDGAVRIYDIEKMVDRLDVDISNAGKNTEYVKLWRTDNLLDISAWKALINDYYRDNRLIAEYLGFNKEEEQQQHPLQQLVPNLEESSILDDDISDARDNPFFKYVPYSMKEDDGVLVNISYLDSPNCDFSIGAEKVDIILYPENKKSHYFDFASYDFFKLLKKKFSDFFIPQDVYYMAFQDEYTYIPLILHKESSLVDITVEVFIDFLGKILESERREVISFSVSYPFEDNNILVSFIGDSNNLLKLFSSSLASFPRNREELHLWIDDLVKFQTQFNPRHKHRHDIIELSGILPIQRKPVKIPYEFRKSPEGNLECRFEASHITSELSSLYESGKLHFSTSYIVHEVECYKCRDSYFKCDCAQTGKIVKKFKPAGLFYTDRPIQM
jgi:hypothetical protein